MDLKKNWKRAERRYNRYVKGTRRIKADRASHVYDMKHLDDLDRVCSCFLLNDRRLNGLVFSRFADTPKLCGALWCCGNPRRGGGLTKGKARLTVQELKAPTAKEDW